VLENPRDCLLKVGVGGCLWGSGRSSPLGSHAGHLDVIEELSAIDHGVAGAGHRSSVIADDAGELGGVAARIKLSPPESVPGKGRDDIGLSVVGSTDRVEDVADGQFALLGEGNDVAVSSHVSEGDLRISIRDGIGTFGLPHSRVGGVGDQPGRARVVLREDRRSDARDSEHVYGESHDDDACAE
jgi:hypothetical protein